VGGVESVGGEDWIDVKTETVYAQLLGRVKCEQEVSVLCCVFLVVICVQVCVCVCVVLYCVFNYTLLYCTVCLITHCCTVLCV
jgi:hypothetical protein